MIDEPLVSVIMGTYNESNEMLCQSIESILNQTYKNIEFYIIIDNPSNEELKKTVHGYSNDNRIKIIENRNNIGLANSLNIGIRCSKGKYICRMDADDIAFSARIAKEVEYMENNPECGLVYTARKNIDEKGNELNTRQAFPKNEKKIKRCLDFDSPITHPTVMMKASIVKKLGGYRNFKVAEDLDLWRRIRNDGWKFHFISEPLLYYRIRATSVSKEMKIMEPLTRYWIFCCDNSNMDSYYRFIDSRTKDDRFVKSYLKYNEAFSNGKIWNIFIGWIMYKELRRDFYSKIGFQRMVVMRCV